MTQTTEGTGPGSVSKVFPPLYNGVVKLPNISGSLLNNLMRVKSEPNWLISADDTIDEVSPETEIYNSDGDDEFIETEIGFAINFAGIEYSTVYVGSNSYITFGQGGDEYNYSSYEDWASYIPGLYVGVDDNSYQVVLTNATVGDPGNKTTTIRFQGSRGTSEDSDVPIIWEMTFYEANPERISLNVLQYNPDGGVEGDDFFSLISDGSGNYQTFSSVDLPKLNFDFNKKTATGESINFNDEFVVVAKDGNVLNVDTSKYKSLPQVDIDDSDHVLSLSDAGKHIYGGDCTITVPYHADVPFPIGTKITIVTTGNGITIDKSGGSTVIYADGSDNSSYSVSSRSIVHLLKTQEEEWYLYGENIST